MSYRQLIKNREQVIRRAVEKARATGKTFYVVYDDDLGRYAIATSEDMDTYYWGEEAVFCTDDMI